MNCPECGAPVGADEKFCGNCGSPLPSSPSDPGPPDTDQIPEEQSSTDQDQSQEAIEQEAGPEQESQLDWSPADAETIYSNPAQLSEEPASPAASEPSAETWSASDSAGSFEQSTAPSSQPPAVQKSSTDRTLVIVIVVLVILLLCCCFAAIGLAIFIGTIDGLNSMSAIISTLTATL
jgi:hypothetical protein